MSPILRRAVALVPLVERDRDLLGRVLDDIEAQVEVDMDVLVVDATLHGLEPEEKRPDVRYVREVSPSRGLAWHHAIERDDATWVALFEPRARYAPDRVRRELDATGPASVRLVLCNDPTVGSVDGAWECGLLAHREVVRTIDKRAFTPAELALREDCDQRGALARVDAPLFTVTDEHREEAAARTAEDRELLRLANEPHDDSPGHRPEVTVLMATHDRRDVLPKCLEGFARQPLPLGTLEIIVIDDASTDGTREFGEALELAVPFRYFHKDPGGATQARIFGLPHARGRIVLFVNDDTIPFADLVERHLAAHRELNGKQAIVLGTFEQPEAHMELALTRFIESSHYVFDYASWTPGEIVPATAFYTCNLSLPLDAVRAVGGFDPEFTMYAEDTDLGIRLENAGWTIHYRPECRATHDHLFHFEMFRRRQPLVGIAHVRLFAKHPDRLRESAWAELDASEVLGKLDPVRPFVPEIEQAARALSAINLARLERVGGRVRETAGKVLDSLGHLIARLNLIWWYEGFETGFRTKELTGFPDVIAQWGRRQLDAEDAYTLLRPAGVTWPLHAEAWLGRHVDEEQGAEAPYLLIPVTPSDTVDAAAVRAALGPLLLRAHRFGYGTPVAVLEIGESERSRLFEGASGWLATGTSFDLHDARIAAEHGCPTVEPLVPEDNSSATWPLSTLAPRRILAWPTWDDPQSLGPLVPCLAAFLGREDTCVILRRDPDRDADPAPGLAAIERALSQGANEEAVDVMLEESTLGAAEWARLAQSVDAVLDPGDSDSHSDHLAALGRPVLRNEADIRRWLTARDLDPTFQLASVPQRETLHA